jgi:hypothetical protein
MTADEEMQAAIDAWNQLPAPIRTGIKAGFIAMVNAAGK